MKATYIFFVTEIHHLPQLDWFMFLLIFVNGEGDIIILYKDGV